MSAEAVKTPKSINFDLSVLRYLDSLKKKPVYEKLSRSALVNMIIEQHAEGQGTELFPNDPVLSKKVVNGD